jgi:predicted N-acetyltransferase YhbS/catechol 2,3-dioxygenase-like lactoylglutathione lyase family enzyme
MNAGTAEVTTGWPDHLPPEAVRFTRSSGRYDDTVWFYREVVGLPVVDTFTASFGEDGTIFGLPKSGTHLEILRGSADDPRGAFDQLVLYLGDHDAVQTAIAPLRGRGLNPVPDRHPYWQANGAVVYADPDGRQVVFAPWVYCRDPEPVDHSDHVRHGGQPVTESQPLAIGDYNGDRSRLRALFELAEDSVAQLEGYIDAGRVLAARRGGAVVGHLQLVATQDDGVLELKNMAVVAHLRGAGIGRALIASALAQSRAEGRNRVVVATATADIGNLRFYQRCGFRFDSVERDAFTPETGYPDPVVIDGIPLLDRIWLSHAL